MKETGQSGDGQARLLGEALDWIAQLIGNEAGEEEIEALLRWRSQSPEHEAAFKDAVRLWRHLAIAAQELAREEQAQVKTAKVSLSALSKILRRLRHARGRIAVLAGATFFAGLVSPGCLSGVECGRPSGLGTYIWKAACGCVTGVLTLGV
ncbi:MAG TPA: DUF4880 domain-containing protein [Methylocella sp.]|nr:DUF4880 domain-containing protein [Methylocella sp.]